MGIASGMGRGLFWRAQNLTWVSLYFLVFEGRMLIQGPEGFWGRGAYLAFDVPNLGIYPPIYLYVLPTSVFYGSFWYAVELFQPQMGQFTYWTPTEPIIGAQIRVHVLGSKTFC